MTETALIERVVNKDNNGLIELTEKYDKLYFSMAKKYINFVDFDFNKEKYNFFFETAKAFDPNRGMKFSSFLAQRTKYLCKTLSKKKRVHIELDDIYHNPPPKYIPVDELKIIKSKMESIKDKQAREVLLNRYFSKSNTVVPFSVIAEKLQMSLRNVKYIHDRYINFIRISTKNV